MKKVPPIWIYLGLAALLGGYIYFFERGPKKDDSSEKKTKVFAGFVADDIANIRVENLGATRTAEKVPIEMRKDEKGIWQILSPAKFKADESTVRMMLSNTGDFIPEETIENPANLADFGLDRPVARCSFLPKSGSPFTLLVGNKSMTGASYYVKTAEKNTVYLLATYPVDPLKKDLKGYRDRTFFKTDSVLAGKVRIAYNGKTFVLEKNKENAWDIISPIRAKADETQVRQLLNTVGALKIDDFSEDHPASLSPYGLAAPKAEVEVWPSEGGASKAILVGRPKSKNGSFFAKDRDLPFVVLIPAYFEKTLDIKLLDYRDKSAMKFDQAQAKSLTIERKGNTFVYQKDTKNQWSSQGRPKAQDEAAGLVSLLSATQIEGFAEKGAVTGLATPSFIVRVVMEDGKERIYRFGRREKDKVYLAADRTQDVYLVQPMAVSQMETLFSSVLTPIPSLSPVAAPKK